MSDISMVAKLEFNLFLYKSLNFENLPKMKIRNTFLMLNPQACMKRYYILQKTSYEDDVAKYLPQLANITLAKRLN